MAIAAGWELHIGYGTESMMSQTPIPSWYTTWYAMMQFSTEVVLKMVFYELVSESGRTSSASDCQYSAIMLQAGEYLLEHLDSVNSAVVLECARGLLALVAVRATQATWSLELGSLASGSASSWGPAAVAALCELWDRQPQGLGHAQIMAILAPCLKHLAVHLLGLPPKSFSQLGATENGSITKQLFE